MAIYLIVRLDHIAHMRDEVPNHKDAGLHKDTDVAIYVAGFIFVLVLTGAVVISSYVISGQPEQIPSTYYEVALALSNVAVIMLFAALAACRGTTAEPEGGGIHSGPGWAITRKNRIYIEPDRIASLAQDQFFYGASRTRRKIAGMKDGSLLTVEVSFLPNPDAPDFFKTSPSFYDEEVDRGFKQFLDELAVLDDPTDDHIRKFASAFAFPDLVIAKVESLKPGRELLKTDPVPTDS
jgi:hypothetical protein